MDGEISDHAFAEYCVQRLCIFIVLIPPNWRDKHNCLYFSFIIPAPSNQKTRKLPFDV